MDINEIITAISTLGFPIAACLFFMWQSKTQDERAANQMEKLNDILANNTKALQELTVFIKTKLGDDD